MNENRFRLPADSGIGAVRLRVADLDRSIGFYGELLGFEVLDRGAVTAALGVDGGAPLVVLEAHEGIAARPPQTPGLYHFAILYPDRRDLGRLLLRLFERQVPFQGFADHGVSEAAYLADPDGNGVELYADRPRHVWERVDSQIVMVTHVLNVTGLLRAVDGDPWTGPPASTRIGHVHLHVADLARAVAFYRDGLGMDVVNARFPGAVFLSAGGYHHHVAVNTWATGPRPADDAVAGMVEFALDLPDPVAAEAIRANLEESGSSTERDARGLVARDPDGNRIRLS